jgi:phosphoglucosamine mutase
MRAHGYNLGGEQSGHIIFSDYCTTGDGLVAALQILAIVKRHERPVSEICRLFQPLPQILKNVAFSKSNAFDYASLEKLITGAKLKLGNSGRILVRPSGTEPLIRVMGEGDDSEQVEQIVDEICESISLFACAAS